MHQKWKYYREEKQDSERFLIFFNIEMLAKSNKIELSEGFMVMWREEQTLWGVISPSYRGKNEKEKSFRSSHRKCSLKKVLLEILQIHRKAPVPESLF